MSKLSPPPPLWAGVFLLMSLSVCVILLLQLETDRVTGMFPDATPIQSNVDFLASVAGTEKEKRACESYAQGMDRFREYLQLQRRTSHKLTWGGIAILLLWSGMSIAAFVSFGVRLRKYSGANNA